MNTQHRNSEPKRRQGSILFQLLLWLIHLKSSIANGLILLIVLLASSMGVMAQVGTLSNIGDQTVCFNSTEDYGVVPTTGSIYTWSIIPGTGGAGTLTNGAAPNNLVSVYWTSSGTCSLEVTEININGCSEVINTILITVLPVLLPGTIAADQTICYNSVPDTLRSVDATGGTGKYTYQWQSSADNVMFTDIDKATLAKYLPEALTATTWYRLQQTSGTCGTVITDTVKVTVHDNLLAGTIAANQTICYNTIPTPLASVDATGGTGSYTYQWQSSTDSLNFTDISGATLAGYVPEALTATTWYRLKQTSGTCGTVTTDTVKITIQDNLKAGKALANQTICYNSVPDTLRSIDATGGTGTYTYQWQSSADNVTFTDISGATSAKYSSEALKTTTYYRLQQTSGTCGTVTTDTVKITIQDNLKAGKALANQTICYNSVPDTLRSIDATGGTGTYTYQWQSSADNVTFTDISGATSVKYIPEALKTTTYYRLQQTSGTCGTVTTDTVKITIQDNLKAGKALANQTICYNSVPDTLRSIDATGGTGTYTYQWQSSADNATFTDIDKATLAKYIPEALKTTTYYRLQQTSGTCGTVTTDTVKVTIQDNLKAGKALANQTICYNSVPDTLRSVAATGGTGSYTYQWQSSADDATFTDISGATSAKYSSEALIATTYYRLQQTSGTCGTVTTDTVKVTIQDNLKAGKALADQTICYNSVPDTLRSVDATGGTGTYTYQWQSSADNATFTAISGATSAKYSSEALTATTYYRLEQTSGTCGTVTTDTVKVTIQDNLKAGKALADQTICYNSVPDTLRSVAATGGTGSYTYQWQSSADNATFTDISGATSAKYSSEALKTTTYYRLQQTSGTCGTVTTDTVKVTIQDNLKAGKALANQTICYNSVPDTLRSVDATGGTGKYTYQWQSSADNATFNDISGATSAKYSSEALKTTTYYRLQQTSGGTCGTVITDTVKVTVNTLPTPTISGPAPVCATTTTSVYTTEPGMTNYVWAVSAGGLITSDETVPDNSITVTWNTIGTQTVSVNYTNLDGCSAATVTVKTVTVDPLPATSPIYHK